MNDRATRNIADKSSTYISITKIPYKKLPQDTNAAKIFYDEVANVLERAISGVLSRNALLYFAFADFEEGRLKYEKVHQMYQKFLAVTDIDPTLVRN